MIDLTRSFDRETAKRLDAAIAERLNHGDLPKWQAALDALPDVEPAWRIDNGTLVAGGPVDDRDALTDALKALIPWRKGPLTLGGVFIDTEWRSDWKWNRIAPHVDLAGKRVLDIGAGNGYFGWRMLEAGAREVVACDPTVVFWMQYNAIRHFTGACNNLLLPLRFEELPDDAGYDAAFSLGVLYHRRDPAEHLARVRRQLARGGTAVIETLVIPGEADDELDPQDRYANMRNVHRLPTRTRLLRWMAEADFDDARIVDVTPTTIEEQRATGWMPFHSLAHALRETGVETVEGLPAPRRATVVATNVATNDASSAGAR
jgi:tRNA (mo5U34)-methyltransferase